MPLLTMPKTHVPQLTRPQMYLRYWPNIDSSISTVFPRPPSLILPYRLFREQVSLSPLLDDFVLAREIEIMEYFKCVVALFHI